MIICKEKGIEKEINVVNVIFYDEIIKREQLLKRYKFINESRFLLILKWSKRHGFDNKSKEVTWI